MHTYSVLIIGAGKIGALFDSPGSDRVLTHAHAFSSNPGFSLVGFVDADLMQAERAAETWGGKAFGSLKEAFERTTIDVAVVSVPDEFHYPVLKELVAYPLKLIFAEKPLAKVSSEAEEIIRRCHERKIPLAMNYSRRFVPEFAALRTRISGGEFGRFLAGTGYYGKGTLHNGSHMVDLLRYMLGEVSSTKTLGSIIDCRDDDPTCSALLEFENGGRFIMQGVDCRCYTLFEMDLLFESKRVRLVDSGFAIEENDVSDSVMFAGYRGLSLGDRSATGLDVALATAADSLYNYLSKREPLPCTGDDGLQALSICKAIIDGLL